MQRLPLASSLDATGFWLDDPAHRAWLRDDTARQVEFFQSSLRSGDGFHVLGYDGAPLPDTVQELHTTTRLVHSYAMAKLAGFAQCDAIIDKGMAYLRSHHLDAEYGGYLWAMDGDKPHDTRKLAYGHVFVLLAGSSAKMVGHPDADALIADVSAVLDRHFWEDGPGLLSDEWNRNWTPFSSYRGMNANMHGVEALLAAYEATGNDVYLARAGRILDFFMRHKARENAWRLPEHYDASWNVDEGYSGNPMFRPEGTTPGHSFELGRLMLHWWDLAGRPEDGTPQIARTVIEQALNDGWDKQRGGIVYTLDFDGNPAIRSRYWWPVTEAIGSLAALIKLERRPDDEVWYRRLWTFAEAHFVDVAAGGWFPEIGDDGKPQRTQFNGKPDIYHAIQATLFPLCPGISGYGRDLGTSYST